MAFVKIRGAQIQDEVVKDHHIANDAAIAEHKLVIDWATRGNEILATRKLVDFVQVNNHDVSGLTEYDLTAIIPETAGKAGSDDSDVEGVIIDGTKNYAPLRDSVSGDPILSDIQAEVYGRVTFEESPDEGVTPAKFVLSFFSLGVDGTTEVPFTMPAGQVIDFQFAQRFNLQTISEMFAANEKFVEGAADATAYLNIEQLARDLYGSTYTLDRDGLANLSRSLAEEIVAQTSGIVNTDVRADSIIDEVVTARGTEVSLDARLDRFLHDDGRLKAGTEIHVHKKFVFQAVGGETTVSLPEGEFFQMDDTLDVYVNGLLQAEGIHYVEIADVNDVSLGTGVDFNPEVLVTGDVIIFKYQLNNAE